MRTKLLLFFLCLLPVLPADCALPPFFVRHYDIRDGLSDNMVVCMHQDRRGMMWFGSFDGLNSFDGYTFTSYKMIGDGDDRLNNNRVDRIREDSYGYLWLQTYDGRLNRFDPRTEKFGCILPDDEIRVKSFEVYDTIGIWINTAFSGGIFLPFGAGGEVGEARRFCRSNGLLPSDTVNRIFRDSDGKVWLLTVKGLVISNEQSGEARLCRVGEKSAGNFVAVAEGKKGLLFGTEEGICWYYDKLSEKFTVLKLPVNGGVRAVSAMENGSWLLVLGGDYILVYNAGFREYRLFGRDYDPRLRVREVPSEVYTDHYGEVWMELEGSVAGHYNPWTGKLDVFYAEGDRSKPYVLPNFQVFEDNNHRLWVHPSTGRLSYYNRETGELEKPLAGNTIEGPPFSDVLHTGYADRQGNLWLCSYSRGIEEIICSDSQFRHGILKADADYFVNEIRAVYQDREGMVWIANKSGEVYLLETSGQIAGQIDRKGNISTGGTFGANVYVVCEDHRGRIWLGTKGEGLFCLERLPGRRKFRVSHYVYSSGDIYSLPDNNVYSVYEDAQQRLWVGTYGGGLCLLEEDSGSFRFLNPRNGGLRYPLSEAANVRYVTSDRDGNLWVGTTHGLVMQPAGEGAPQQREFCLLTAESDTSFRIRAYDIHYILPARDGSLYFATFGGGLHCIEGGFSREKIPVFKNWSTRNGFPSDIVLNIVEDEKGILWMSSEDGIIRFTPGSGKGEKYDRNNGLDCAFFSEAAVTKLHSGEILVGSSDGYFRFYPDEVKKSTYVPPIVLNKFLLFNRKVELSGPDSLSGVVADYTSCVTLLPGQSVFGIEYSALDYVNAGNVRYAYRLQGFEREWNEVGHQRNATYTNLAPGEYIFEVRSTNSDGVWVDNVRRLNIRVLPSFWQSAAGKWLMVVLMMLVVTGISFWLIMYYRMKDRVKMERRLTDMKLRFFTDISHELRTPLTLIASPVDYLLHLPDLPQGVKEQLQLVGHNTARMLRLVNQILDFRKIQNRKMKLRIEQFALGAFVGTVCDNFAEAARERNIRFEVFDLTGGEPVWADRGKVESILFNLLSNAFKFTPQGKAVTVTVRDVVEGLQLEVKDEGTGMNKEQLKGLFVRFNSFAPVDEKVQQGTGIGLSLTRELVEMHHGTIEVDSTPGYGSCFRVKFRKGTAHYAGSEDFIVSDQAIPDAGAEAVQNVEEMSGDSSVPLVLVAEDHPEVRQFLRIVLTPSYRVMEAEDGIVAWEMVQQYLPDILISDVMMPGIDGIELTTRIRKDIRTSHLQIILLTARTTEENKIEGVKCGADDYITKPFSANYLLARLDNMLVQRRKLQEYYCSSYPARLTPSKIGVKSSDEVLMDKLVSFMEENMDNPELSVEDLVPVAGIGRSSLFKKLKSLTGMAPVEFIREIRIRRAAQLIECGEYNISEISYRVGINEPRYFSRCFKKRFGMTPTEYRKKMTES